MLSVKKIVEAVDDQVIVVVSALGGITDKLIATSRLAAAGDSSYEKGMILQSGDRGNDAAESEHGTIEAEPGT